MNYEPAIFETQHTFLIVDDGRIFQVPDEIHVPTDHDVAVFAEVDSVSLSTYLRSNSRYESKWDNDQYSDDDEFHSFFENDRYGHTFMFFDANYHDAILVPDEIYVPTETDTRMFCLVDSYYQAQSLGYYVYTSAPRYERKGEH